MSSVGLYQDDQNKAVENRKKYTHRCVHKYSVIRYEHLCSAYQIWVPQAVFRGDLGFFSVLFHYLHLLTSKMCQNQHAS